MSDLIHQESVLTAWTPSEPPDAAAAPSRRNPMLQLLRSIRRHWLMVLLIWALLAAPATVLIWKKVKPSYTATAQAEVVPVEKPILYPDLNNPLGAFDGYLNTQAQLIVSTPVLRTALADPRLKGLALLERQDPMTALRQAVTVEPVPRTYLLNVKVKQSDPDAAIRLARAVMASYESFAGGSEARERAEKLRVLHDERRRLEEDLQRLNEDIYRLAQNEASSSQGIYDLLRESQIRVTSDVLLERRRAESERLQLKARLQQLEKGLVPTSMPTEDLDWRERYINEDQMVRSLEAEQARVAQWLARPRPSAAYQEEMRRLEARLQEERARAGREADRKLEERHRFILEGEKKRVAEQLKAIEDRIAFLDQSRETAEQEGMQIGKLALEIKRLQDDVNRRTDELQRVDQELHRLEVESHRPDRIFVNSEAEILPDGIEDKRKKLTYVAVLGCLFFSFTLAIIRDLWSQRLYTVDDVESGMGLRLLGVLPALDDLHRGRIGTDDFRESYRAIRTTLAGGSPEGRIPRSILITSAQAAEGKTSLAVSLGASLAESGCRVLVIDGDVQAPRIGPSLSLNLPGRLRDVLLGECSLADAAGPTPIPGLDVLLGGRNGQTAEGLLTYQLAARLLKEANERYDHVIIDSPPVLGSADPLIWSQAVNGVIVSCLAGHSSLRIFQRACERLVHAGGRLLGAVVCNVSARETYYSYSSRSAERMGNGDIADSAAILDTRRAPCIHLGDKVIMPSSVSTGE